MDKIIVQAYQEGNKPDVLTQFLDKLNDKNDVKKVRKLIRILEIQGRELAYPLSKFLGSGIYELRDRSCGIRVYYTFIGNALAILLVLGDKTSQKTDIERAQSRRLKLLDAYKEILR
ncbi:MAG: type II toxin-antitoxin system RelE/ParE family toxin [Silvanigrellaceae bacterium]|nr:type II toxin-antitoxin system RelE/ParE family toxin [Silvanigrellaceae bacterium]